MTRKTKNDFAPVRTYAEVGAMLGITLQAVENTERRALAKLRKRLMENGGLVAMQQEKNHE